MGRKALVAGWPVVLALAICAPLLAPGYVLSYDMVFVPDLDLRRDVLGLGTALPRAVPSDAVVAVLDSVTGGMLLQKVVLLAIPAFAGWGAALLVRDVPRSGVVAALAAATLYVWNPFVAERLVLGHWPLLIGYAALPWLVRSCVRVRRGVPNAWPGLLLASAACALSASGGLVGTLVALLVVAWPRCRARQVVALLAAVAALNAPWWVVGLAGPGAAVSDPAGAAAFAARDEGYGGVLPTLLTLGGVWNADVVPESRGTLASMAGAVAIVLLAVAGTVLWWRRQREVAAPVTVAAALMLGVALLGAVVPAAARWLVEEVPGGGLLRDGQRYLGPLALLQAAGFGLAAGALAGRARRRWPRWSAVAVAGGLVLLPVAVLPDLAWGADGRLRPVAYPGDWSQARRVLDMDPHPGDLLPWPFESYRAPAFNGGRPVVDPLPRYLPRPAVVPDELVVGGVRLAGEDPRAAAVAAALRSGTDATAELLRQGVGWIVWDRQHTATDPRTVANGARPVFAGPTLTLYVVDGDPADPPEAHRTVILAAWLLAAGTVAAAAVAAVVRRSGARA